MAHVKFWCMKCRNRCLGWKCNQHGSEPVFHHSHKLRVPDYKNKARFRKFVLDVQIPSTSSPLSQNRDYNLTKDYFLNKPYPQRQYLEECLNAVKDVDTKRISAKLLDEGKQGKVIGEAIRIARIDAIRGVKNKWKLSHHT